MSRTGGLRRCDHRRPTVGLRVPQLQIPIRILPQPDDTTCGPTCLHAVYAYFGEPCSLADLIAQVTALDTGGTLAVFLANHALRRGYRATIYTYNLNLFDPTWFAGPDGDLVDHLQQQAEAKPDPKVQVATLGYQEYLTAGGQLRYADLSPSLLRNLLKAGLPILTGLSATHLYREAREFGPRDDYDDIRGLPAGHFVVLCGYDDTTNTVTVADPMHPNPCFESRVYQIDVYRVINAILLGVLTYDANLLILEPPAIPTENAKR